MLITLSVDKILLPKCVYWFTNFRSLPSLYTYGAYTCTLLMIDNFFFQTYLEQTKTKFNKKYKGMNQSKITTTVGLNSKYNILIHDSNVPYPSYGYVKCT